MARRTPQRISARTLSAREAAEQDAHHMLLAAGYDPNNARAGIEALLSNPDLGPRRAWTIAEFCVLYDIPESRFHRHLEQGINDLPPVHLILGLPRILQTSIDAWEKTAPPEVTKQDKRWRVIKRLQLVR